MDAREWFMRMIPGQRRVDVETPQVEPLVHTRPTSVFSN
jgi:hypothetical protein